MDLKQIKKKLRRKLEASEEAMSYDIESICERWALIKFLLTVFYLEENEEAKSNEQ